MCVYLLILKGNANLIWHFRKLLCLFLQGIWLSMKRSDFVDFLLIMKVECENDFLLILMVTFANYFYVHE